MNAKAKKTLKIAIPLGVCAVLIIGLLLFFFLPPESGNYYLQVSLHNINRGTDDTVDSSASISDRPSYNDTFLEAETGDDIEFWVSVINRTKRWQKVKFEETELLKVTVYRGEEKIYEKAADPGTSFTFPWRVGCRCYSGYFMNFQYTFEEAGTYTVVVTSRFSQLWKDYSYTSPAVTVSVK